MDSRTVVAVVVFVELFIAAGMVAASARHRAYAGFRYWTGFFVSLAFGLALLAGRGLIPEFLSVVVAYGLAITSLVLMDEGLHRFHRQKGPGPLAFDLCLVLLSIALTAYFTYAHPSIPRRIMANALFFSVISLRCALLYPLRNKFRISPGQKLITVAFALYPVYSFVRALRASLFGISDPFMEGWAFNLHFIMIAGSSVLALVGCLLLIAERVMDETRVAQKHLDALMGNLPGVVYRVGLTSPEMIEYVSKPAGVLPEFPVQNFEGRPVSEFRKFVDPGDNAKNKEAVRKSMAENTPYRVVYRVNDPGGRAHYLLDQGIGVADEEGIHRYREGYQTEITARVEAAAERERILAELERTLEKVKTLTGLIPVCSSCKKVRDDRGYWKELEDYLVSHTDADLTHGICPECIKRLYPDFDPSS